MASTSSSERARSARPARPAARGRGRARSWSSPARAPGPDRPGVRRVAADAADAAALAGSPQGRCPLQLRQPGLPPLGAGLAAARRRAARRGRGAPARCWSRSSNLYGYGPVDGPMTEDLPLAADRHKGRVRARMWEEALAAHRAGRIRVTEVRGSDYFGPGAPTGRYRGRFVPAGARRPAGASLGDSDAPHSWTYAATWPGRWSRSPPTSGPGAGPGTCPPARRSPPVRWPTGSPPWPAPPRPRLQPARRTRRVWRAACSSRSPGSWRRSATSSTGRSCSTRRPPAALGLAPTPLDDALRETIAWWRGR